ncbi:tetratricopeptide repeat protein [Desulfosarcina ovata]|uniref:Uncharacterized protein n=1 Tax=Desulfosarcina ovata subsp. ovata TaxID=2752305 RepID=A0A5K8A6U8_9BACT|nr:tetratricopeptide repeat protein [Desulfosarcina ovata]BBO88353.1 hypothetical protein DSCOOX_15330 [Desulfosarcina ovata subsp. ovata]
MTITEDKLETIKDMISNGGQQEALTALTELVDEEKGNSEAHSILGNLYYSSNEKEKALCHYEKSAQLEPDNTNYLKSYADLLYSEKQDAAGALIIYEKLVEQCSGEINTIMMAGHLSVSVGNLEKAVKYYNAALDIEPWNFEAPKFLEAIKRQTEQKQNEVSLETAYQRCLELENLGQTDAAIDALKDITVKNPDFALAYNDLGVLLFRKGNKAKSLEYYEKAVSIDPNNANFQKNLADFYLIEQGEVEKALNIYLSVLTDNPEDIEVLMVAGHICSAMGKFQSASVFYDRILSVEPWNIEASERLNSLKQKMA